MHIKVINPDYGMSINALQDRVEMLSAIARPDTEISMDCITNTKVSIDSRLDIVLAGPEIVSRAIQAEKDGYDAVVLYCLSDPAITACREAVKIPVIGGGQTSMLVACSLGNNFSIITTSERRIPEKKESLRNMGIELNKLASVRGINVSLDDTRKNTDETISKLVEVGKRCRDEDAAEVIVLGCLSFAGMGSSVSDALGIPVVDPAFAAINMAELLYVQKLSHSKITYPNPPSSDREWRKGYIKI